MEVCVSAGQGRAESTENVGREGICAVQVGLKRREKRRVKNIDSNSGKMLVTRSQYDERWQICKTSKAVQHIISLAKGEKGNEHTDGRVEFESGARARAIDASTNKQYDDKDTRK